MNPSKSAASCAPPKPMPIYKNYFLPTTINDALKVLDSSASCSVRLIAGGTDLLLDLQQGRQPSVDTLVDVSQISEMLVLEKQLDTIYIGAAVPLKKISSSSFIQKYAQALAESTGLIAGPQVRNTATLGGNVAHALPAGDGTISLLALDAWAEIVNSNGVRKAALKDMFVGPGESVLNPRGDILVRFILPAAKSCEASAFKRVMRPQGVALPIVNMAIWVQRQENKIADIRIALGPAGPTPQRGYAAEEVLKGKTPDENNVESALQALLESIHFRTSPMRGSAEYRRHLCGVLLRDTLKTAWNRTFEN